MALLVLGTMAISLFAGFSAGFSIVMMAREDERATQILNGKIEAIRLCKWSDLTNLPVISFQTRYDPPRTNDSPGFTNSNPGVLYLGTISSTTNTIATLGSVPYTNDMRLVTVSVQWTNYSGKNPILRTRTLQTLVARYGIQNYFWGLSQ